MIDRNLRIVFMGTPEFAVPSLQYLLDAGYQVASVVTAPDKPGGRGMKEILSSAVKNFASAHKIPVLQPVNLKSRDFIQALTLIDADLFVVVAFRMLPEIVWKMPAMGTINLHGSLLPAFRGAAPIQWAIINGEHMTGVTTFRLQREIDTGEILLQREIPILHNDDSGTLHDRMMPVGAGLIVATVDLLSSGQATTSKQDPTQISHAPKIHHEDGRILWHKSAVELHNLIRGMSPYPGAWSSLDGKEFKILKAQIINTGLTGTPGSIVKGEKNFTVQTGFGQLELLEVQMTGKRKMGARDFLNGYAIKDWSLT